MKHPERIEDYLEHIATAIQRATEYVERSGSVEAFRVSQRDQDAVIRNIEIIGEAARQLEKHDPQFVKAHPELPWRDMQDMRHKMIHNYFDVDLAIVWATVKNDLPPLKQQIGDLLRERHSGPTSQLPDTQPPEP